MHGDRVHLTNAVFNLLDNAVKYGREDTTIELRTRDQGNEFLLSVKDQGIGIRKEDLKNIFERFYRVHTGNVHNVKGFGLGLHYVQEIAQAHGGGVARDRANSAKEAPSPSHYQYPSIEQGFTWTNDTMSEQRKRTSCSWRTT